MEKMETMTNGKINMLKVEDLLIHIHSVDQQLRGLLQNQFGKSGKSVKERKGNEKEISN